MADEKPKPMLDYVVDQLRACSGTWPRVASDTGIPYFTIAKIAQKPDRDFGVRKIQKLHDYFRDKEEQDAA